MKQIIIQFGGTGDLARKKLIPAYYELFKKKYDFHIIFLGRRYNDQKSFFDDMVPEKDPAFLKKLEYFVYDMKKDTDNIKLLNSLQGLREKEEDIELIYYLALHPGLYEKAIEGINKINTYLGNKLNKKVVVEKPFGFDLKTAVQYNSVLKRGFDDEEIFRVDHYVGKEFIQNLLVMRFQNDIIHGIWNKDFIDHVQIIIDEDSGVDQRLDYYEKTGVIRDMVQNHVLQIVTSLTMGEPVNYTQSEISYEKTKILRSIKPIDQFVIGRYKGLGKGEEKDKGAPTFIAFKCFINNYNFSNVPFYIRTGKRMPSNQSIIYIQFKNFRSSDWKKTAQSPNAMIIEIQPHMRIDLLLNIKQPGKMTEVDSVKLNFDHFETFKINTPEAYEQILQKILEGDKILFPCEDEIHYAWELADPLIEKAEGRELDVYEQGTVPESGTRLIEEDGRCWFGFCSDDTMLP
jgi:glucose-6-phosphate 1-dehydrogenase